ncbi:MAG: hypothetical protein MHM6MM_000899 [Cercozoa sp. M6MM]
MSRLVHNSMENVLRLLGAKKRLTYTRMSTKLRLHAGWLYVVMGSPLLLYLVFHGEPYEVTYREGERQMELEFGRDWRIVLDDRYGSRGGDANVEISVAEDNLQLLNAENAMRAGKLTPEEIEHVQQEAVKRVRQRRLQRQQQQQPE